MLNVWGRTSSTNVQKVLWCCEELEIAYERVDAGLSAIARPRLPEDEPQRPRTDHLRRRVSLCQSNTIVHYLCARYGRGTLWNEDPADRLLAERWMDSQLATLWPAFRVGFLGLTRKPPEQRDPDAVRASLQSTA